MTIGIGLILWLPRVPKNKLKKNPKISFCKILKSIWYHVILFGKKVLFEWTRQRIPSTDSKNGTTLRDSIKGSENERVEHTCETHTHLKVQCTTLNLVRSRRDLLILALFHGFIRDLQLKKLHACTGRYSKRQGYNSSDGFRGNAWGPPTPTPSYTDIK